MDILVFVKQVPDDSVEIHLDGAGVPAVKDAEKVTNAFDTYAMPLMPQAFSEARNTMASAISFGSIKVSWP